MCKKLRILDFEMYFEEYENGSGRGSGFMGEVF